MYECMYGCARVCRYACKCVGCVGACVSVYVCVCAWARVVLQVYDCARAYGRGVRVTPFSGWIGSLGRASIFFLFVCFL